MPLIEVISSPSRVVDMLRLMKPRNLSFSGLMTSMGLL